MWTDGLTPIRWIFRGILLLIQCTITLVPTVLCQSKFGRSIHIGNKTLDERMLNGWSRLTCRAFGVKTSVSGKIPDGPVLIVANHVSWLDIQVLHSVARMSFVGKAEIDTWPIMGLLARRGGTVFHQRGSHDSANQVMQQIHKVLDGHGRVAIFPEGGILPGDHIKRFHARMFKVAVEARCPVQPTMIRYTRDDKVEYEMTFLRGENFITNIFRLMGRPASTAELKFLQPYEVKDYSRNDLAKRAWELVNTAYEAPVGSSEVHE